MAMRITLGKAGRRQQGGLGLREKRQRLGQPGKGWSLGAQERASGLAPVAGLVAGPGCWVWTWTWTWVWSWVWTWELELLPGFAGAELRLQA